MIYILCIWMYKRLGSTFMRFMNIKTKMYAKRYPLIDRGFISFVFLSIEVILYRLCLILLQWFNWQLIVLYAFRKCAKIWSHYSWDFLANIVKSCSITRQSVHYWNILYNLWLLFKVWIKNLFVSDYYSYHLIRIVKFL